MLRGAGQSPGLAAGAGRGAVPCGLHHPGRQRSRVERETGNEPRVAADARGPQRGGLEPRATPVHSDSAARRL